MLGSKIFTIFNNFVGFLKIVTFLYKFHSLTFKCMFILNLLFFNWYPSTIICLQVRRLPPHQESIPPTSTTTINRSHRPINSRSSHSIGCRSGHWSTPPPPSYSAPPSPSIRYQPTNHSGYSYQEWNYECYLHLSPVWSSLISSLY